MQIVRNISALVTRSILNTNIIKMVIFYINGTVFIAGDYKQSIYGFQGAEPEYFLFIQILL